MILKMIEKIDSKKKVIKMKDFTYYLLLKNLKISDLNFLDSNILKIIFIFLLTLLMTFTSFYFSGYLWLEFLKLYPAFILENKIQYFWKCFCLGGLISFIVFNVLNLNLAFLFLLRKICLKLLFEGK